MREIKFRAWDKARHEMLSVGQITFVKGIWGFTPENEKYIGVSIPFQPHIILMQSTGLKDKNGKEIYEGDIIKPLGFASWIGVARYATDKAAFVLKEHDNKFLRDEPVYLSQFVDSFEILGNIYESPELMEVE